MGPPHRFAVRAVTFDIGGTLIAPWPSVGHIYAQVAAEHGHTGLAPELLNQQFGTAWQARKDFQHTQAQWAELVDATFFGLIDAIPSRTFFPQLFERFVQPAAWRIFDDVRPALDMLRSRGLRLGVISNWDHRLRPLLRGLNLVDYFECLVISCEVGCSKPARGAFERAAKLMSLAPETLLHVGDSPEMDVQGARAAGFGAVLLDRNAGEASRGTIRSLRDLGHLITG